MDITDISEQPQGDLALEIAHVLIIDIVGYSRLLVTDQVGAVRKLTAIVRGTDVFRKAEADGILTRIPTGDGMALIFADSPEGPVRCALEVATALRREADLAVRMGVHSGPVNRVSDVNDRMNVAGTGVNLAQRVMDCGDAGHILVSGHVAEDLIQYQHWRPYLTDLGECEVKHGVRLRVSNLVKDGIGNPAVPEKLRRRRVGRAARAAGVARAVHPSRWPQVTVGVAVALSLVALAISAWLSFRPPPARAIPAQPVESTKSVAVLPFTNLSGPDDHFAFAVQDEILTDLAKVADLKVISRTSVMQYTAEMPRNLREIAKALNVAFVLEGSVQRSGNRIRVQAQLIDAKTDTHVWADRFDRDVADVFAVQAEVAERIVSALRAKITPQEKAEIEAQPTSDLIAFAAYARAKELINHAPTVAEGSRDLRDAITLLEQAVARDPKFALAFYQLAHAHDQLYLNGSDHTPQRIAAAQAAIEALRQLQPASGETNLAAAKHLYWVYRKHDEARKEVEVARTLLPNEPVVYLLEAYLARRQGRWSDAIANFDRAIALDPRNAFVIDQSGLTFRALRRYSEYAAATERALQLAPNDPVAQIRRAAVEFEARGDIKPIHDVFVRLERENTAILPRVADVMLSVAFSERNLDRAERAIALLDETGYYDDGVPLPRELAIGQLAKLRGDNAASATAFNAARAKLLEIAKRNGSYAELDCAQALVDSYLGRREALDEVKHAKAALTVQDDAMKGPMMMAYSAAVSANLGDFDGAIEELQGVLRLPGYTSYGELKFHPLWDSLRGDLRFEKIVASLAPKS